MNSEAILWCCCAGDRERLLYATETTDEAVPTHDQNKLKKYATEGFCLPCAVPSTSPGLWRDPFQPAHMISFLIFSNNGTRLPLARWPLVTKELRTTMTCWHQPLSWSCLPVCTTARGLQSPSTALVSCEHSSQALPSTYFP